MIHFVVLSSLKRLVSGCCTGIRPINSAKDDCSCAKHIAFIFTVLGTSHCYAHYTTFFGFDKFTYLMGYDMGICR